MPVITKNLTLNIQGKKLPFYENYWLLVQRHLVVPVQVKGVHLFSIGLSEWCKFNNGKHESKITISAYFGLTWKAVQNFLLNSIVKVKVNSVDMVQQVMFDWMDMGDPKGLRFPETNIHFTSAKEDLIKSSGVDHTVSDSDTFKATVTLKIPDLPEDILYDLNLGGDRQLVSKQPELSLNILKEELNSLAKVKPDDFLPLGTKADLLLMSRGKFVKCHERIVCQQSTRIREWRMFQDPALPSYVIGNKTLDSFHQDTIVKLIDYFYLGKILPSGVDLELLRIADELQVPRLKLECEFELGKNLNFDNVLKIWVRSQRCNAEHLKACVIEFVKLNWNEGDQLMRLISSMILESEST